MNSFREAIYRIVSRIPPGKVLTYGDVARLSGTPSPRAVGRMLHINPDPARIPCHRVVFADGSLAPAFAFGGANEQRRRLTKEHVTWKQDRVDLEQSRWNPLTNPSK